jgi:hypothetical protein
MSTLTDDTSKWIMSIADSRTDDGSEYYESTDGDSMVFKVLSLYDSESQTEDFSDVENDDVELTVDDTSSVLPYSKIDKLENYGLVSL